MEEIKVFKALSDPTRNKIVKILLDGEMCVCNISPKVGRTQSTVSIQLSKLKDWGILRSRRDGKIVYYSICDPFVKKVLSLTRGGGKR